MSVFRRKLVFRSNRDTFVLGSLSVVTASLAAGVIAFGGSAAGSTSGSIASASGAIEFGGGSITTATMQNSATGSVVLAGSASGLRVSLGSAAGTIQLAGLARPDVYGIGTISFGGSATVGTIFTMDASGAIAFGGTALPVYPTADASGAIAFSGTVGAGEISGGTVEASASGRIDFAGVAAGAASDIVQGAIVFGGVAIGTLIDNGTRVSRIVFTPFAPGMTFKVVR
jgi:hypothetical protein